MAGGPTPARRERGWLRVLLALAVFLLVPADPLLRALLPIEHTWLLLVPALTVCFVAGWLDSGRWTLGAAWLAGAVAIAWWMRVGGVTGGSQAYGDLALAWGLLAAGAFGAVCVVTRGRPFLHRALSAVGLAVLLGLLLAGAGRMSISRVQSIFADEFLVRNTLSESALRQSVRQAPALATLASVSTVALERTSAFAARAAPALIAIEALAAMALAWALYHRLGRARIGPPLAPLRDFSFDDQLIWGFIAGLVLAVVPAFRTLEPVGINLVVFFAALYLLRGWGVAVFLFSGRRAAFVIIVVLAALLLGPALAAALLALGISDTWFGWRHRPRAT